jgi:hypothetical protein
MSGHLPSSSYRKGHAPPGRSRIDIAKRSNCVFAHQDEGRPTYRSARPRGLVPVYPWHVTAMLARCRPRTPDRHDAPGLSLGREPAPGAQETLAVPRSPAPGWWHARPPPSSGMVFGPPSPLPWLTLSAARPCSCCRRPDRETRENRIGETNKAQTKQCKNAWRNVAAMRLTSC